MITKEQYFGDKLSSAELVEAGIDVPQLLARAEEVLLPKVNAILERACTEGVYENNIDTDTGTQISGTHGGAGDGGFRLPSSTTGVLSSKHRLALAVDVFDPHGELDKWLTDEILTEFGLYREHPESTPGWCHLQCVQPGSGHRTFQP